MKCVKQGPLGHQYLYLQYMDRVAWRKLCIEKKNCTLAEIIFFSIFHNATCGSIQLKQDKVTTAQYCILKVKKRKFTQTLTHTPIHTRFSYSEKFGVNLGKQSFNDGISSISKSHVWDL